MIANIGVLILETVKLLLALCGCLNYKMKRRFIGAWVVFGVSVLCLVMKGIQDSDYRITSFTFVVVVISAMMIEGKRKGLLVLVVFLGISVIDTTMIPCMCSWLSLTDEQIFKNPLLYWGVNAISLVGIMVAAVLLQKLYYGRRKKGKQELHNSGRLYFALFAIGLSASMMFMLPVHETGFIWNKGTIAMVAIALIVFAVVFLVMGALLIYNNSAKRHYQEMARMNQRLGEMKEDYYRLLLEKEEETKKFRHDMSAHLVCIKTYLEEEKLQEAKDYLECLRGTMRELSAKHQTGHTLVNAIVNDVSGRYTGVNLNWRGHLPIRMQLSDMDICVIFSNLLENAFLAASNCEDGGTVDVMVKSVGGALAITMENTIAKPIEEKDGELITQKTDKKNHGYGTRNVRTCVEKNEGEVTFAYTEKNFTVNVFLNNVA